MSSPYSVFAAYYDYLMQDVDYDAWTNRIVEVLKAHHPRARVLVDLACGTGNITGRLAKKGYAVFGVDISEQMLMIAQDKAHEQHLRVQYLKQDMMNFRIHRKADAITAICDGLNYLTEPQQLASFFKNASLQLNPEGVLVLDLSSIYKYEQVLATKTIAELDETVSFIWENHYDADSRLLDFDIAFFVKQLDSGLYKREMEHHRQKAHTIEEIQAQASPYFEWISCLDGEVGTELKANSERWLIVLKKK